MTIKVKCTNINWAVEDEDVIDGLPENVSDEEIVAEIERIKSKLPHEVTLKLEADSEADITEDYVSDELSEQTGWLHEGFDYEIV